MKNIKAQILRHHCPAAVGRGEVFAVESSGWEQLLHHQHTPVATAPSQHGTQSRFKPELKKHCSFLQLNMEELIIVGRNPFTFEFQE